MVIFEVNGRSGEWACDRWVTVEQCKGSFRCFLMEHLCDEYMPDSIAFKAVTTAREALAVVREWQKAYA